MILEIQPDGSPRLVEADDCTTFHIGGHRPTQSVTVDGLEFSDDLESAFVDPSLIERLAIGQVGEGWDDRFAAMLDYAAGKGWLDAEDRIQGHCEWSDGDDSSSG